LILIYRLFKDQYGDVELDFETNQIHIRTPSGIHAIIDHVKNQIECDDPNFKLRLEETISHLEGILFPLKTTSSINT
jgi:cleavage and polyadenylation specificity factor subunit 3